MFAFVVIRQKKNVSLYFVKQAQKRFLQLTVINFSSLILFFSLLFFVHSLAPRIAAFLFVFVFTRKKIFFYYYLKRYSSRRGIKKKNVFRAIFIDEVAVNFSLFKYTRLCVHLSGKNDRCFITWTKSENKLHNQIQLTLWVNVKCNFSWMITSYFSLTCAVFLKIFFCVYAM